MTNCVWNRISLDLPDDWEMLQFTKDAEEGRCAFADRYEYRLEVSWKRVPGPPDFERMVSDYQNKIEDDGAEKVRPFRRGAWQGLRSREARRTASRLGRFFEVDFPQDKKKTPATGVLVELVFLWPGKKDSGLEDKILKTVTHAPLVDGSFQRWHAFGMDMLVTDDLELTESTVRPAHVEMTWHHEKRRLFERFARRGMVPDWLVVPVPKWLPAWVGDEVVVTEERSVTCGHDHEVHIVQGLRKDEFPKGKLRCDAAAWICPHDGRLYSVFLQQPRKKAPEEVPLAGLRLTCCGGLKP